MPVDILNPEGLAAPIGYYSHLAVVPGGTKLLVLAGQVGTRIDGTMPDSLVIVQGLAREALKVEVEAQAALPA